MKVDFKPNLLKTQKKFQIFVKKEGFWGSEKSSSGGGTLSRGGEDLLPPWTLFKGGSPPPLAH